jgi:FkbM family methyltransferase
MRRPWPLVAQRLVRHEPRARDGLALAVAALRLWARRRLNRSGVPVTVTVSAPRRTRTTLKLWTYIDVLVVMEVFVDGDYRLPSTPAPAAIIDLGANTGVSVRYLRAAFPEAAITAVEADPVNFARLAQNAPDAMLVQAAVAAQRGVGTFYSSGDGWGSSLRPKRGARPVQVRLLTLADLLEQAGVRRAGLLKIDIEGGEWPLLEAGALQAAADCIVGELHFDDGRSLQDAVRLFDGWRLDVREKQPGIATFTAIRDVAGGRS